MPEMRACKECGKMFMPKGREKYCSDVHYRPCPVCGTPVVAKYLSDPPCKCKDCRGKKVMQPASKVKSVFKMPELTAMPKMPELNDLAKSQPGMQPVNKDVEPAEKPALRKIDSNCKLIDVSKIVEPEEFCEAYDDKVMRYIGPEVNGFKNNHDYKIALNRKDNYYMLTSCHDLTDGCETNCFYIASSQISVSTRFAVVEN